jgi:hypothetical protein
MTHTTRGADEMGRSLVGGCFRADLKRGLALLVAPLLLIGFLVMTAPGSAHADPLSLHSFSAGALNADETPSTLAGAHPFELRTAFEVDTVFDSRVGMEVPVAALKDTGVELPPGAIGNPSVAAQCKPEELDRPPAICPTDSQVGIADLDVGFSGGRQIQHVPIYNMVPPPGEPAQLGFVVIAAIAHIDVKVRSNGDYGLTATVHNANGTAPVYGATIHLWGVPADPSHNAERFRPGSPLAGDDLGNPIPSQLPRLPFLRNPTSCSGPLTIALHATSWQEPDQAVEARSDSPANSACSEVPFGPTISMAPDTKRAGAPSGFDIDLTLPQNESPGGISTSDLKKVAMTLPQGVTINPSSADGLAGCDDAAFDIGSTEKDECPNASRIGGLEIHSQLLEKPLTGSVFLATPLEQSPAAAAAGRMYRLFLEAEGSGVRIKLAGSVVPDPLSGQLTATFDNNPQLPFESLHLELNGGPRAPLTTPEACGTYTTQAQLTPWARPTEPVLVTSKFRIAEGCANAAQFTPSLEAGTTNPLAGKPSPVTLRVVGQDGQQNLARIEATLPEGVLAKLRGVPLCADGAAISGDCPAASQVGATTVAAGAGSSPIYVPQPDKAPTAVYLAGPYKGAPYSMVVKVPAQAGPFDLGTVAVRNALYVDPTTAQVTAKSDPLPQILLGVPISYRDVRVNVDRNDFTINPTNCDPMKVTSMLTSIEGSTASPSDRFQAAGCGELGFKPSLALSLKGKTKRSGNPALTATLKAPPGQANIAKTTVVLPRSEFIDNAHINSPCTRVQFNANACPPKSILGTATAYTPLLDQPLSGPVYFRSNGGERELPDMVADLNGQIHVTLVGFIDSVKQKGGERSRVRTRFLNVPDAPVSKFVLKLKGGKQGLIENSEDLCQVKPSATVQMTGQNAKSHNFESKIATSCGGKKKGKKSKRAH